MSPSCSPVKFSSRDRQAPRILEAARMDSARGSAARCVRGTERRCAPRVRQGALRWRHVATRGRQERLLHSLTSGPARSSPTPTPPTASGRKCRRRRSQCPSLPQGGVAFHFLSLPEVSGTEAAPERRLLYRK